VNKNSELLSEDPFLR